MQYRYKIEGMTCSGCSETVANALLSVQGVETAHVDLQMAVATLESEAYIPVMTLQENLPGKYTILQEDVINETAEPAVPGEKTKLQQLRPLFLIFVYLFGAAVLLNYKTWNWSAFMLDFMGLFFIVFSFFKFLDLKGFPASFAMYDPLARVIPVYGWIYPFLELGLGLMLLLRFEINIALIVTVVLLGITTIGVTRSLLGRRAIKCACLGTALNLPMTEATFIENTLMIAMAIWMLLKQFGI